MKATGEKLLKEQRPGDGRRQRRSSPKHVREIQVDGGDDGTIASGPKSADERRSDSDASVSSLGSGSSLNS